MRHFHLIALIVTWAALYLPALGTRELQGEEARRVLPGRTMLQTGEYIVPRSGGQIYNRKPPLVNWVSAAAITITGSMDEWTVRLPSVLMMLALALTSYYALRSWLGKDISFLTALILLTNIGFIEKGRLIEIEALYYTLYGIALVLWLGLRFNGRPTAAWLLCGVFSGIAFLAKGPPHLLYLYLIIIAILKAEGKLRELIRWPHLASLGLFVLMWLPWALVNMARNPQKDSANEWSEQITHRLGFIEFDFLNYALQVPQSFVNFLPWAIFIPLWFLVPKAESGRPTIIRAIKYGTLISFFIIAVLPSSRPRFMLPCNVSAAILTAHALYAIAPDWIARISTPWRWVCWLVAFAATCVLANGVLHPEADFHLPLVVLATLFSLGVVLYLLRIRNVNPTSPRRLALYLVLGMMTLASAFATVVVPRVVQHDELRPFAAYIRSLTGPDDAIVLYRVGEQMWPFYLGMGCIEITDLKLRPRPTKWMILPQSLWQEERIRTAIVDRLREPLAQHALIDPIRETPLVLLEFSLEPNAK